MGDDVFNWAPRRILVGYDGSAGAADAVEFCRAIAPADATVALVNVLPYPGAPSGAYRPLTGAELPPPEDYFDEAIARLPGRDVYPLAYVGASPARIFEDLAREAGFDLVIVGSPHRGTVGRILVGSVAEALLHGAPVPAVIAPRGFADHPHDGLATIAVAYDGGEESQAALAYAQSLAHGTGASLDVLTVEHAVDPIRGAIAYTMSLPENVDDIQRQALQEVDPAIDLRRRTLTGTTAEALATASRDADLIVIGSRAYGTLGRVLLGSTSAALIHQASCPVMVVPRPVGEPAENSAGAAAGAAD